MAGRKITLLRQAGAACDHPIDPSYPEGAYLSNILFRVLWNLSSWMNMNMNMKTNTSFDTDIEEKWEAIRVYDNNQFLYWILLLKLYINIAVVLFLQKRIQNRMHENRTKLRYMHSLFENLNTHKITFTNVTEILKPSPINRFSEFV